MVLIIFKIIATSGFLAVLECTKFVFGHWGAYSAPTGSLAGLRGTNSKARGEGREGGKKGEGKGRGRGRKGRGGSGLLSQIPGLARGKP